MEKIHFKQLWPAKTVSSKTLSKWKTEDNASLQAVLPHSLLGYTLETQEKIPSLWEPFSSSSSNTVVYTLHRDKISSKNYLVDFVS